MPAWSASDALAALLVGDAASLDQVSSVIEEIAPEEVELMRFRGESGETVLKVRRGGADKGTALRLLAEERGLSAAQTVAAGDWYNDIPMLKAAGLSFAMARAEDAVRSHAGEVLTTDGAEGGAVVELARRVWGLTV